MDVRGYLHRPASRLEATRARPGILIVPGFADTAVGPHTMHALLARELCAAGFAVLRFDYRGQGESDGSFREFTIESGLSDVRHARDFLMDSAGVEPEGLGVYGYSLGGALAAELARDRDGPRAAVLLAPAAFLEPVFTAFFAPTHRQQMDREGWADWLGWPVGRPFLTGLGRIDPVETLRGTSCRTLVIHGTADTEVPPENGRAYEAAGALLRELSGADHQFSSVRQQEMVFEHTLAWFGRFLRPEGDGGEGSA